MTFLLNKKSWGLPCAGKVWGDVIEKHRGVGVFYGRGTTALLPPCPPSGLRCGVHDHLTLKLEIRVDAPAPLSRGVQGYLAHNPPPPPLDPTVGLCLGFWGVPGGWAFSYERGTPVGGERAHFFLRMSSKNGRCAFLEVLERYTGGRSHFPGS